MKKVMVVFGVLLMAVSAYGVLVKDSSSVLLGSVNEMICSTGMTCTKSGRTVTVSSSPTLAGSVTITAANAADGTFNLQADNSDDSGDDWAFLALASGNSLVFQNNVSGSLATLFTFETDGDSIFGGTTPYLTMGDAGAEDAGFAFDGNAQDFNISLDDSTDDLVIGLGTAAGTTDAIRVDENQDVTFVKDILPLETITGDGGSTLSGMLQKQTASTTASLTIAQCGETIVSNSADVIVLPEASTALGCRFTFVCGTADDLDINPADGTDQIGPALNSVAGGTGAAITPSAGDAIRCTDIGSSVVLEAVGADLWAPIGVANGAFTDVN
jgi:hypothetical protein